MKSAFLKMLFLIACLISSPLFGYYPSLLCGVYEMEGSNPNSNWINYHGEVEIRPNGNNFLVTWRVGNAQMQTGIGILREGVLSVAFYDLGGKGCGVVSFTIIDSYTLEGVWAIYPSTSYGREWLTYKHS